MFSTRIFHGIFFLFLSSLLQSQIVINEFLASNKTVLSDIDGQETDWIELYNTGSQSVNLEGYALTDDFSEPVKWIFPSISIEPNAFLLVWASGKNYLDTLQLHTNFKLNAAGEIVALYNHQASLIDHIVFGVQATDVSMGRFPDGSSNVQFFTQPTPNLPNYRVFDLEVNPPGGLYQNNITVYVQYDSCDAPVYYSIDGSMPTQESTLYVDPIPVNRTTVFRAAVVYNESAPLQVVNRSYFIDTQHHLPVLSLVSDPENFWHPDSGIYVHWDEQGLEWERTCHIALFEKGEEKFSSNAGVRIHGDYSRQFDKKSLRLHFKTKYDNDELNYQVFDSLDIDQFEKLVLYAGSRDQPSGSERATLLNNVLTHSLYDEMGGAISFYKPVVLYLNQEYWGIYWIREHINEYYLEDHLGIIDGDLNRSSWHEYNIEVITGDESYWFEAYNFIKYNDMRNEANYEKVKTEYINIENFIDYYVLNIFAANESWLHKNTDRYRNRQGNDRRWHWLLWDTDRTWNASYNDETLLNAMDPDHPDVNQTIAWRAIMLNRLLKNNTFEAQFVNRFADLMNTNLKPENIFKHLDPLADMIRDDMPDEFDQWALEPLASWDDNLRKMKAFIEMRPYAQRQQIVKQLDLMKTIDVIIESPEGEGDVQISTVVPDQYPWEGVYFSRTPIPIKAVPATGYRFAGWSNSTFPDTIEFSSIFYESLLRFNAIFEESLAICDIQATQITDTSATLSWKTNYPAMSYMVYGKDSSLTDTVFASLIYTDSHEIGLNFLDPGTGYQFQIHAWEFEGDTLTSDLQTFTTQSNPPVFESVLIDSVSYHTAYITWRTNESTRYSVRYGLINEPSHLLMDSTWSQFHGCHLQGLLENQIYYLAIKAENVFGDSAVIDSLSFTTAIKYPLIYEVVVDTVSHDYAKISWKTDDFTRSHLSYGTDSSFNAVVFDSTFKLYHTLNMISLMENTTYFFQISSIDSSQDQTDSPIFSFTTFLQTNMQNQATSIPDVFSLSANYPNPFNQTTWFQVHIPHRGHCRIVIYNIAGRQVVTLFDQDVNAGIEQIVWDGINFKHQNVVSGIYLCYTIYVNENNQARTIVRRFLLIR